MFRLCVQYFRSRSLGGWIAVQLLYMLNSHVAGDMLCLYSCIYSYYSRYEYVKRLHMATISCLEVRNGVHHSEIQMEFNIVMKSVVGTVICIEYKKVCVERIRQHSARLQASLRLRLTYSHCRISRLQALIDHYAICCSLYMYYSLSSTCIYRCSSVHLKSSSYLVPLLLIISDMT
jgi:hypothetical protein